LAWDFRKNFKGMVFILTTCKNIKEAEKIGRVLLQKRLAACVLIIPGIVSAYRWKGKIVKTRETFLLIKTFASKRRKTIFKFPKGHLNKDEVLKQAAMREVEEEGRIKSRIVAKIGSNDYIIWDKLKKKKIVKKVTFF